MSELRVDPDRLCAFCVEEHRGACAHPDCPIAFTGGLATAAPRARPAPSPTRPSVAGGEPARRVDTPPPSASADAPAAHTPRRHIATQPSVHAAAAPPRGSR